jgi:V/A-type H+-transporting ATPase subunit E
MGVEEVVEKILADAKAEAEKIKTQADEKQTSEQAKLDEQLNEYKKQTEALAQKAAKDEMLHRLAQARMTIAKELLTKKGAVLDEVFDKACEQLQNLPDDDYRRLMTTLMLEAVETGDEAVIVDKNEKRIDQELIEQVNHKLGNEYKANLKLSEERQELGAGFILRRGNIKSNVSIQVLLAQARKELEIELAKELFS